MSGKAEFLQALLDTRKDGSKLCSRCQCCEMVTEECDMCDEGYDGHDCGEDCCCCEDPIDNVPCDICCGRGYFTVCIGSCDSEGKHVKQGEGAT